MTATIEQMNIYAEERALDFARIVKEIASLTLQNTEREITSFGVVNPEISGADHDCDRSDGDGRIVNVKHAHECANYDGDVGEKSSEGKLQRDLRCPPIPHTVAMNELTPLLQFGIPGVMVAMLWRLIDRGFEFRVPPRRPRK